MLALDPVPTQAPPPRRPLRRRPWLRWLSTVGVAFIAAVCVLVGPTTTEDAARAVTIPPVIASLGDEALPATILEMNPAGFAITGALVLGYLAYDNRATLAQWGRQAWCWISGCDATPDKGTAQDGAAPEVDKTPGYTSQRWSIVHGSSPGTLRLDHSVCTPIYTGGNFCASPYLQGGGSGQLNVVCRGGVGASFGPIIIGRGGTSGGVTFSPVGGVTPTAPSPRAVSLGTQDPNNGGLSGGTDFYVCPGGYEPARADWYNTTGGSTGTELIRGSYTDGTPVPTDSRIDVNCRKPDGSTYTVQGPVTTDPGDHSAGLSFPACAPGDEVIGTTVNTRATGDSGWSTQQVPNVAAPDQVAGHADCLNSDGSSNGTCSLNVTVNGKLCTLGDAADCWDWKSEETTGATVQCVWGPSTNPAEYVVGLGDCDSLGEAYRTGHVATSDGGTSWYSANTDGTPSQYAGNAPAPSTGGGTAPGTGGGTDPGTGGGTSTGTFPSTGTNPGADPGSDNSSCWGSGWSWNPVSWVYVPVKCVLQWAFVPDQTVLDSDMQGVRDSWRGTAVGQWVGAISTVGGSLNADGGSCDGPPLVVGMAKWLPTTTLHLFSSCADPEKTVAFILKNALAAVCWVGTFFACAGSILLAVGYRPPITEPEQLTLF